MSEPPNNQSEREEPPQSDEEAKLRLHLLGREALTFLRDERPQTYRRLEKAGRLHLYAWERQEAAEASIARLVESGMKPEQAWEIVAGQYLQLPEE